jgi:hypothetical protein
MSITLLDLKRTLAKNKVYDAWQYVCSLSETFNYMNISYDLLDKVYTHRKNTLDATAQEVFSQAVENKGIPIHVTQKHLDRTHLFIANYELDDSLFLRKTSIEFFHYARLSIELLMQVTNIALFGDDAFDITERNLPTKVTQKLAKSSDFANLKNIIDTHLSDPNIKYLIAFDNYIKHIKTILVTISNSFIFGSTDKFEISEFVYDGTIFSCVDAMSKMLSVKNVITNYIEAALTEINVQIPNCLNNSNRFQQLKFKQIFKETTIGNKLEYMSYFLEVENDLTDLPTEIKVMPLLINSEDEVNSFVLDLDEIFITKKEQSESGIIGIATAKTTVTTNELYRTYVVKPCSIHDYYLYIANFTKKYNKHHMNFNALEGEIIFLKE